MCPGGENSQRCVVVGRASDVHVKILGYTLTLPAMWLGGDSQDTASNQDGQSPFQFNDCPEIVVHVGRRHVLPGKRLPGLQPDSGTDGSSGPQSQERLRDKQDLG